MSIDPARLMRFVLEMRQAGITDARALSALERAPRTHYAPAHLEGLALDDVALPLAHGQTMTKPPTEARCWRAEESVRLKQKLTLFHSNFLIDSANNG